MYDPIISPMINTYYNTLESLQRARAAIAIQTHLQHIERDAEGLRATLAANRAIMAQAAPVLADRRLRNNNPAYDIRAAAAMAHEKYHNKRDHLIAAMGAIDNWQSRSLRELADMLGISHMSAKRYRAAMIGGLA